MFTRDLIDTVWIGSAVWYQMGPLTKVIPYGTVPFQFRTGPNVNRLNPMSNGPEHIRSRVNLALDFEVGF